MSLTLLATLLLPAAAGFPEAANAGAAAPAAKRRTLKELIAFTEKAGEPDTIEAPTSANLGFDKPATGTSVYYSDEKSPDHLEHHFTLIKDGKRLKSLLWGNTFTRKDDQGTFVSGWEFRTSPSGKLERALFAEGYTGHVVQTVPAVGSKDVSTAFEKERRFHLETAVGMTPDKG